MSDYKVLASNRGEGIELSHSDHDGRFVLEFTTPESARKFEKAHRKAKVTVSMSKGYNIPKDSEVYRYIVQSLDTLGYGLADDAKFPELSFSTAGMYGKQMVASANVGIAAGGVFIPAKEESLDQDSQCVAGDLSTGLTLRKSGSVYFLSFHGNAQVAKTESAELSRTVTSLVAESLAELGYRLSPLADVPEFGFNPCLPAGNHRSAIIPVESVSEVEPMRKGRETREDNAPDNEPSVIDNKDARTIVFEYESVKDLTNYAPLHDVLLDALRQAAYGNGKERHAEGQPFTEQRMQSICDMQNSANGMVYQAIKKATEGMGFDDIERQNKELLGAIVYLAGVVVWNNRRNQS